MNKGPSQAGHSFSPWEYHCQTFSHAWRRYLDDVRHLTPDLLHRHRLNLEATLGLNAVQDKAYVREVQEVLKDAEIDERAKQWAARVKTRVWQDRADYERDVRIIAAIGRAAHRGGLWGRVKRAPVPEDPRAFDGGGPAHEVETVDA